MYRIYASGTKHCRSVATVSNHSRLSLLALIVGVLTLLALIPGTIQADLVSTGDGTWVWQNPLPQGNTLNGVSCPDVNTCFAVGASGTILTTTNGGSSWTGQSSGTSNFLTDVSCPDANTCFVVDQTGVTLATTNGGSTWSDPITLRDDGGTPSSLRPDAPSGGSDVGYPISTQLSDGSILTVYYITLGDGITHSQSITKRVSDRFKGRLPAR